MGGGGNRKQQCDLVSHKHVPMPSSGALHQSFPAPPSSLLWADMAYLLKRDCGDCSNCKWCVKSSAIGRRYGGRISLGYCCPSWRHANTPRQRAPATTSGY